jgi:hypothetical protein
MGRIFFKKKVGPQALSAQIGLKNRFRNRFDRGLSMRKIDSKKLIKKSFHDYHLKGNGGAKSRNDSFSISSCWQGNMDLATKYILIY